MTADQTGSLQGVRRHDYLPFGEEIGDGVGGRTAAQGYGGDNVRRKFTGYERDREISLDYAQARYYSYGHGRFASVNPLQASASAADPQSFNRYSYALNNPVRFHRPDGDADGRPGWLAHARQRLRPDVLLLAAAATVT